MNEKVFNEIIAIANTMSPEAMMEDREETKKSLNLPNTYDVVGFKRLSAIVKAIIYYLEKKEAQETK